MAYKFQRGDFTASGSINVEDALTGSGTVTLGTATADLVSIVGAASFNDGNITNVGDIALDSISGDGDVIQIGDGVDDSVNFALGGSGNGSNYMVLPDNKASAWQFLNTGDETNFLTIKTTNGLDCLHTAVPISGTYFSGSAVGAFVGDGSSLTNISMDSMDLTRGYVWIGDSDGEAAAVDSKTSGQILVGDGTDVNSVAVSGDVTISSAGAVTIANNAVETAMILSGAVSSVKIGDQQLIQRNFGTGSVEAKAIKQAAVTMAAMATGSVENNAYATGSVENAHLAGSIANAKLANSSLTIGDSAISLGGTDTTLTGLTDIDMTAADHTILDTIAANTLTVAAATTTVAIPGTFNANGTVTLGDAQADVTTVTGQLTASHGALFSNDISIPAARVLYLSGKGGQNKISSNGGTNLALMVQNDLTLNAGGSGFLPETTSASYIGLPSKAWLGASIHALSASYIGSASLSGRLDADSQNIINVGTLEVDGVGVFNAALNVSGNANLGNAQSDVSTVGSQLTASYGIMIPDTMEVGFSGDGALDFSAATTGNSKLVLKDNLASSFKVAEGSNDYMTFITTNSSEGVQFDQDISVVDGKKLKFAGDGAINFKNSTTGQSGLFMTDNLASALTISQQATSYLKFTTTNNLESMTAGVSLTGSYFSSSVVGGFVGDGSALTNVDISSLSLSRGYVWIGDSDGEASAVDANDDGKILIGDGTDLNSVAISGDVTITSAGAVTIGAGVVDNAMLANDGITMGTTDVSLGDSITAFVGLTDLDMTADDHTIFDTVAANDLTIGASSTAIIIPGLLDVSTIFYSGLSVLGAGTGQTLTSTSSYVVVQGSASAVSVKLPADPDEGTWFAIKRSSKMSAALTLDYNSGKQIDGDNSIVLETAGAAVTLIYDGTTQNWNIF